MPELLGISFVKSDAMPPDEWLMVEAYALEKLAIVEYPDGGKILEYGGRAIMRLETIADA